jgi:hypothetical protein
MACHHKPILENMAENYPTLGLHHKPHEEPTMVTDRMNDEELRHDELPDGDIPEITPWYEQRDEYPPLVELDRRLEDLRRAIGGLRAPMDAFYKAHSPWDKTVRRARRAKSAENRRCAAKIIASYQNALPGLLETLVCEAEPHEAVVVAAVEAVIDQYAVLCHIKRDGTSTIIDLGYALLAYSRDIRHELTALYCCYSPICHVLGLPRLPGYDVAPPFKTVYDLCGRLREGIWSARSRLSAVTNGKNME